MTDSTALIVILTFAHVSLFCIYYASKTINTLGQQIVIGFIGDHAVPLRQRWLMLYSQWVSYVVGVVAGFGFLALVFAEIGNNVADPSVRLLAYFAAFLEATISAMWFLQGPLLFVSYRSLLRQAEAD